ncbi:hypothetical protein B0A49_11114, partial [Cryomyces minteri]
AGNHVKEQILSSFVRLIATTPDLQTYSVQKLYASLKDDITQQGLTLAGAWVIGEYGDALLRGGPYEEEELVKEVKESDVVDLFTTILNSSYAGQTVTEYIITSAMKLTTRMSDPAQIDRLRRLLISNQANLDIEIQQRAVEYGNLFGYDQIRRGVLEKMPPPEIREEQRVLGEATKKRQSKVISKKKPSQVSEQDMLLDLMGGSDLPATDLSGTINGSQNNADLLADILGGGASISSASDQTTSPPPTQRSNLNSIMDLFDTAGPASTPQPSTQPQPSASASADLLGGLSSQPQQAAPAQSSAASTPAHTAFSNNGLHITFQLQRPAAGAGAVQVLARFRNTSHGARLSGVSLQAAVPKSQKLQLQAISSAEIEAGGEATQHMRIVGVGGALPPRLRLRLKIGYARDGAPPVTEQVDWSEPA